MAKTVGIVSLKGGVGKTSIVSSLGDALSNFGKKVLIVDANFSAPNLGMHFNIIDPEITLHHVLSRRANIKDSIHRVKNMDVIPSSMFQKIPISPMMLKDKIGSIKRKYDFILLDSAPSVEEDTLSVINASDSLIFVTTPDYPTISSTLKSVKIAKEKGITIDGIIINKVLNKDFEISPESIQETTGVPVLAVIPYNIHFIRSVSEFVPYTTLKPKSEGSAEIKKLAATLSGEKYKTFSWKNIFFLTPRIEEINRDMFYERVFQ